MRVHRSLESPDLPRGRVIALGNFDGLHRGHRRILCEARRLADSIGRACLVFTFHPHPVKVLRGEAAVRLLQSTGQKLRTLERWDFDEVLLFPFSHEFSLLTPEEFMERILLQQLRLAGVVVGTLFNFGHDRKGNAETLAEFGRANAFPVVGVQPLRHRGHVVSSTWIRRCIERSDLVETAELLGRPYSIDGVVATGDRRGASIGFPTANVVAEQEMIPPPGVYVTASVWRDQLWHSMTNIGYRPTFGLNPSLTIESHLLDFPFRELYEERLEIFFLSRLRDETTFNSVESLKQQLAADRASVDAWVRDHPVALARCLPPLVCSDEQPH
ncbi:MAG: bifunctional riboflavin kinase/FAD synthetase [Acidobacteriota bacterium]